MGRFQGWPAGVEARPIDKADTPAWAELLAAKEKVDAEGENYDAADLLEELEDPSLDLERDTVGLWADGVMVGYGKVHAPDQVVDVHRIRTEGTVHPEWRGRGLGAAILAWLDRRATELHSARQPGTAGEINTQAISTNTGAHDLFTSRGFEPCRYFFHMHRSFDLPIPAVPLPDGLRQLTFDPSYDEVLRLTHNEVFLDHWGSTPRSPESWRTWCTGTRALRPDLSFLILDGDQIVSYALSYEYEADTAATGIREIYIGQVGTRRSHRGRGLARAALARVMSDAAGAGYGRASLGVDAENPTGALGLYENLGFTTSAQIVTYRLPLTER
ncbi:GNAT family N-acetyltransferase [Kribbella monticola]|uniref:GNAT family N-acetyltransferase n=1 Tax=Kribbella monticola TaxID=2185285 RepID=UPI000DD4589C|nr:GNAT family N-acetyltransferase [Kribbella monticola]